MARSCHLFSTEVAFTVLASRRSVINEQFWGRAVRASCDPKGSRALLNFWVLFCREIRVGYADALFTNKRFTSGRSR
jgi:hypothetical protein